MAKGTVGITWVDCTVKTMWKHTCDGSKISPLPQQPVCIYFTIFNRVKMSQTEIGIVNLAFDCVLATNYQHKKK